MRFIQGGPRAGSEGIEGVADLGYRGEAAVDEGTGHQENYGSHTTEQ